MEPHPGSGWGWAVRNDWVGRERAAVWQGSWWGRGVGAAALRPHPGEQQRLGAWTQDRAGRSALVRETVLGGASVWELGGETPNGLGRRVAVCTQQVLSETRAGAGRGAGGADSGGRPHWTGKLPRPAQESSPSSGPPSPGTELTDPQAQHGQHLPVWK
ncbi:hypothetical protein HJG60_010018 [Phyllostomus discolor]|uniref:Uncharacterized protein n=1 Tax=Phyllostomus discolor TaxID=89673 RepID=A0A834EJV2_9CHIR|nr:hypothetical protein HJG60_010018 [Phyllostomus discolor]